MVKAGVIQDFKQTNGPKHANSLKPGLNNALIDLYKKIMPPGLQRHLTMFGFFGSFPGF